MEILNGLAISYCEPPSTDERSRKIQGCHLGAFRRLTIVNILAVLFRAKLIS
jgi:hypothetical protein